jgi:hypothetical protein
MHLGQLRGETMDIPRLGKSVRKVTVLQKGPSGQVQAVVVYKRGSKKKRRGSTLLRPLQTIVQRVASAQQAAADSYISRHKNSNRKRTDGWIRDLPINVLRAGERAVTKLTGG